MNRILFVLLLGLYGVAAVAQTAPTGITVTYPNTRAVFQRDLNNRTTIYFSGTYYQPIDSLQVRLVAERAGQGLNTNWNTIRHNQPIQPFTVTKMNGVIQGGTFQGAIVGSGGWYRLEVQAFQGGRVISQDVVSKIGVGEVFIITGQSNAQGLNDRSGFWVEGNNVYGAVGAEDERVNCLTYNNIVANSLADPPVPTFEQIRATSVIGPRGVSAWCWGRLGDLIAQQYNVPVLFINTAWGGTSIKNWVESFDDGITFNPFVGTQALPRGMPYANLRIALRYYASLQGVKAILWHQGETDNVNSEVTRESYRRELQRLVDKTRIDTDRYPAWMLARASRSNGNNFPCIDACNGNQACIDRCPPVSVVSDKITGGQTDIVGTFQNNVYAGPFTDNIQPIRPDGVHFQDGGLIELANAWFQSMNTAFFSSALPLLPQPQPIATVQCANNNSVNISLPTSANTPNTIYRTYQWSNGQNGPTLSIGQPGQYQAKVKDGAGNVYLSPLIDVRTPLQPPTPTISLARSPSASADNQQQICADSVLTLVANTGLQSTAQWNNGIGNTTLRAATAGQYSVQAVNTYGCRSNQSSSINLTVRPRLATPSIRQVGLYSLEASMPGFPNNEQFDWRRGTAFLNNQNGPTAKVVLTGDYTARAKALFTLGNGNALTCFSNFSNEIKFTSSESADGVSVYPNPSANGFIAVETIEDLQNAELTIHSLTGQLVYSEKIPSFNTRRVITASGFASGPYIVRVRADGFDVSRRVFVGR